MRPPEVHLACYQAQALSSQQTPLLEPLILPSLFQHLLEALFQEGSQGPELESWVLSGAVFWGELRTGACQEQWRTPSAMRR